MYLCTKHRIPITKTDKQQKYGWRFCQDFWCKIYAKGGGLHNLDQNRRHRSLQKQESIKFADRFLFFKK
jgi:hypothetical protein